MASFKVDKYSMEMKVLFNKNAVWKIIMYSSFALFEFRSFLFENNRVLEIL